VLGTVCLIISGRKFGVSTKENNEGELLKKKVKESSS
jgi:hypothetical protein